MTQIMAANMSVRKIVMAAAMGAVLTGPALAQGLDVNRFLERNGVLPHQGPDPREQQDHDRQVYEQGRRDEEARREAHRREEVRDDDRRSEVRRDDRDHRRNEERREAEDERLRQEQRGQPGRY